MKLGKILLVLVTSTALSLGAGIARGTTYTASAVPFSFIDISATGTVLTELSGRDDFFQSVSLPFSFDFYGTAQSSVFVSTNALLTFGSGNTSFVNTDLTTSPTQAAIAVFWDDLLNRNDLNTASVRTQSVGVAGSRQFVIQWDKVTFISGGDGTDTLTFQAILFEGSNDIRFNYLDLTSGSASANEGASATVGIKDLGTQGPDRLLLAFNDGPNAFVGSGQSTLISDSAVQVIPEPQTYALLIAGLTLLGFATRLKTR
jgi:hypothetical protein